MAGGGEQMSKYHRVQRPFPVLFRHARDTPKALLSVKPNLLGKAVLDQEIDCISRPSTSVTDTDSVDTVKVLTADGLPQLGEVVVDDVLLGPHELSDKLSQDLDVSTHFESTLWTSIGRTVTILERLGEPDRKFKYYTVGQREDRLDHL